MPGRAGRPPEGNREARPPARPRRWRRTPALRELVAETRWGVEHLVLPLFVTSGPTPPPTKGLPALSRFGVRDVVRRASEAYDLGVRAVMLFGVPRKKDAAGTGAWDPKGPVPSALRELKDTVPSLVVMADVCLCEYTSHGHCGVLVGSHVDNDRTLPLLARAAVAYAEAGADVVAPSAMMDHQVRALRAALDGAGRTETLVLSYAAKFASALYGPFRDAAGSAPSFGDRRGYQMDPRNSREAMRELELDAEEGADALMVKPALPCLDLLAEARRRFELPLAAYQVSGEYAMIKGAAEKGWLDEPRAVDETLSTIRRAGADLVISYFAREVAERRAGASA